MKLTNEIADIYLPDGSSVEKALKRTTHLAIGAHQDDIEVMAYPGIASCYRSPSRWFTGVILTDGGGSPRSGAYADVSDEQMRAIRKKEQRKAAALGKYSAVIQLGYPSAHVRDPKERRVTRDLVEIVRAARPEIVYLHNPADKHDTHVAAALRAIEALRSLGRKAAPRQVLGCEVWRTLDWLCDEEKVTLSASRFPALAKKLIRVFDSQIAGGKRYDLATVGRWLSNATYHQSHATDADSALVFAVDLTPLVTNPRLSPAEFMGRRIDRFRNDVRSRLARLDG